MARRVGQDCEALSHFNDPVSTYPGALSIVYVNELRKRKSGYCLEMAANVDAKNRPKATGRKVVWLL